ncbi:transposase [Streptomyces sp. NBC_01455]|nr:Tn3 family transposase [Streptomyces sp. NBC_01455]
MNRAASGCWPARSRVRCWPWEAGLLATAWTLQTGRSGWRPLSRTDASAHYGRIAKTLHIPRLADDPGYRRQIKVQANLQEGRQAVRRGVRPLRSRRVAAGRKCSALAPVEVAARSPLGTFVAGSRDAPASNPLSRCPSRFQSGSTRWPSRRSASSCYFGSRTKPL